MKPIRDPEREALKHLVTACELSGKRVLEIGCGDGEFTRQFAQRPKKVIGIDPVFSEVSIAVEKTHHGKKTSSYFLAGKGEYLPFGLGTFDIVLFSLSL